VTIDYNAEGHQLKRKILLGVAFLSIVFLVARAPLPPSHTLWVSGSKPWDDFWGLRRRMATWLVWTHSLIGESRRDVVAQLGEPETNDASGDDVLTYNLGPSGNRVVPASEWLILKVDEHGFIKDASLRNDWGHLSIKVPPDRDVACPDTSKQAPTIDRCGS
jgi:hypothetical protein